MKTNGNSTNKLSPKFSPLSVWAFSIGTSIGWGSFIVTCNTYLLKSGILGTVFGLIIGMAVIFIIAKNLRYMIQVSPKAGGIYSFERKIAGKDLGFLAFWFVLITYLAILWANITSLPLFARFFLGDTFRFGFHYNIFGYEVWLGEALLSIAAIVIIALLCSKCARLPNKIMIVAALVFAVGFTACAIASIALHDKGFSYSPMYTEGSSSFAQIIRIAAISPWAFIGFENISHFSEEYNFPLKKVRGVLISSVVITTVLYLFVSLLSISAYPPEYESWLAYIRDMGNLEGIKAVPAFYAANHYLGQAGVNVLMCALFGVILTSLIGNMLALSRLLFAVGREGDAPKFLSKLNKNGIPQNAVLTVAAISVIIPFLGRTAIGWIVDVTTLGATLIYGLISQAVYHHAKKSNNRVQMATGIIGVVLMMAFVILLMIPGLLPFDAMETESYILFIFWSVFGLIYFRILVRRDHLGQSKYRIVVWVVLLLLILFASMMWVSRATENAANTAVSQIYEYHESHPDIGSEQMEHKREEFLNSQARNISKTNTLYTFVSLSLFILSTAIMLNNYQDTKRIGMHLVDAREKVTKDALTGAKNKYAFSLAEKNLNERIESDDELSFAIVVCDINNLKIVNDTKGHKAGDRQIIKSFTIIKDIFSKSLVFRIGGDEFAVICQGEDYNNIQSHMEELEKVNTVRGENAVQFAYGMARFAQDMSVEEVFERADNRMYELKSRMKSIEENVANENEIYEFPDDLKNAYERSQISFVYYQNVGGKAVPILASEGFCKNVGMRKESVLPWLRRGLFERMHPDDVGVVSLISDGFINQRGPYDVVFRCRLGSIDENTDTAKYYYIHGLGKWQTMPDGMDLAVITYSNLSSTQKSTREQVETYALKHKDVFYTDPLTGLPNINYLHEFGNDKINVLRAEEKQIYLVYMDIYSMQSYNNQYGYKEGDTLLCLVADTLSEQFPSAFVSRGPDDHFIIIASVDKASQLEHRLIKANKLIKKKAHGNTSGFRAGVFAIENPDIEFIDALDCAKQALKSIENNMNREVAFFSKAAKEHYLKEQYILENFDKALENRKIEVNYHALYRIESGKVAAFEALARWNDENLGKILPSVFVPVLIKYHQLYKLDLYMFEQVCREVILRKDNSLPLVPVSVNFSRQDFDHFDIVEQMNKLYDKYELKKLVGKNYFIVEITEQDLALGKENFLEQLKRIRANGYRLWMDDFGSGYSSLSSFSQYEFDLIKYDMDLLKYLDDNNGANRLILKEFTNVVKKLGIHTLVEGLETEEQLEFVKEIGCDLAQGYYFSKPESLETILQNIANGRPVKICETPEEREELNNKWRNKNKSQ